MYVSGKQKGRTRCIRYSAARYCFTNVLLNWPFAGTAVPGILIRCVYLFLRRSVALVCLHLGVFQSLPPKSPVDFLLCACRRISLPASPAVLFGGCLLILFCCSFVLGDPGRRTGHACSGTRGWKGAPVVWRRRKLDIRFASNDSAVRFSV